MKSEKGTIELEFDPAAPAIKFETERREIGSVNHNNDTITFGVNQREVRMYRNKGDISEEALAEELLNLLV